jgi:hypothetical protein
MRPLRCGALSLMQAESLDSGVLGAVQAQQKLSTRATSLMADAMESSGST